MEQSVSIRKFSAHEDPIIVYNGVLWCILDYIFELNN